MEEVNGLINWMVPLIIIGAAAVIGLATEKVVMYFLRRIAAKTKWEGDEIIIDSLRGMTTLWFVLAGIYGALIYADFGPKYQGAAEKGLLVLLILSLTIVFARLFGNMATYYSKSVGGIIHSTSLFQHLVQIAVFIVGGLILMSTLGISITPLLTALGVGGIAVALALQQTLSNLFSGLHILASGQVKIGDYVRLSSGEEGYVTDITWRNTSIRALPNNMYVVPNAVLASTIITNYYQPETEMAVLVNVGVAYDSDLGKVERVTVEVGREVMKEVQGGVPEFEPFIRYNTFGDFAIGFTVILRAKEFVDQYLIKHEFVKRLHERYNREGIVIPFPIRTVHMQGGPKA